MLTPRERQVVRLFSQGLTYREVAARLKANAGTIRNHRQNIYRKLRINRIATLARWAEKQGIG